MRRFFTTAALWAALFASLFAFNLASSPAFAQDSQAPVASVPIDNVSGGVKVSGALDVSNGRASIGASGTITAGDRAAIVSLSRGGQLLLCATTTLHLAADRATSRADSPADATALLIALDRGALEANYTTGKFSDVVMTPDFRILVSGPGIADLKMRVNSKGDTCIDNHGAGAPYVTVSSQFDTGVYRVQPNQRVMFEHGSLHDVVDNEGEPCGCPPAAVQNPELGIAAKATASNQTVETKPANTDFPLAVSEGLAPPPATPTAPVAAPGETHVQVTVPLAYDGKTGKTSSATDGATNIPPAPDVVAAPAPAPVVATTAAKPEKPAVFHRIGHFFSRLFGGG